VKPLAPRPEPTDPQRETALALAKRWNLLCENGEVVCLRNGCDERATLPSLLCTEHLLSHRRGWR
jgi:hypothetical protein